MISKDMTPRPARPERERVSNNPSPQISDQIRVMAVARDGDPVYEVKSAADLQQKEPEFLWINSNTSDLVPIERLLKEYLPLVKGGDATTQNGTETISHPWLRESARVQESAGFITVDELVPRLMSTEPKFEFDTIKLLAGKNFIVTIHPPDCAMLDPVWERFLNHNLLKARYYSPVSVACVVLEECLSQTRESLDSLTPFLENLREMLGVERRLPPDVLAKLLPHFTKSLAKIEQNAEDYARILHTLEGFQRETKADHQSLTHAHGRIVSFSHVVMGMIRRREKAIQELRQTHDSFAQQHENELAEQSNKLMKDLTVIGTVLAVAGVGASFIQAAGVTLSNVTGKLIMLGAAATLLGLSIWGRHRGYIKPRK